MENPTPQDHRAATETTTPPSRLPHLRPEELDEHVRAFQEEMGGGRAHIANIFDENGALHGPFNAWLYNPKIGRHLYDLGGALRTDTAVDRGLNELAIVVTTAYWRSSYAFAGHALLAHKFGISWEVINAIRAGGRPRFDDARQEIVYDLASTLLRTSTLDDTLYERALEAFGYQQLVELVVICGWYTVTSFVGTTFRLTAPPGTPPVFGFHGRTDETRPTD